MQKRGDPRDEWKLAHWDQYAKRRIEPPEHMAIKRFDNREFEAARFEKLIDELIK